MKREIESAIAHAQAINAGATAMESIIVLDIIQLLRQARNLAARFEYARRDAINTDALHAEFEASGRPE